MDNTSGAAFRCRCFSGDPDPGEWTGTVQGNLAFGHPQLNRTERVDPFHQLIIEFPGIRKSREKFIFLLRSHITIISEYE